MTGIYNNRLVYDNISDHIVWSVLGEKYSKLDYSRSQDQKFQFDYKIPKDLHFQDYKTEVQSAVVKLFQRHNKTLAICLSGRDSEIIVREAVNMGIPCKIYFLHLWDMNDWMLKIVNDIARELRVELIVVPLSEEQCMEEVIFNSYKIICTVKPTYVCLPYLFDNIPKDELIVCGEGDLAKDNPIFRRFYKENSTGIPILSTEIAYRIYAQENQRYGEYYFHSSTPELVLAAYNDPRVKFTPPSIQTHGMIMHYWPKMKFTVKSLNWENGQEKNKLISETLLKLNRQKEWAAGCLVPHQSVAR